ncbi:MAG: hypothetical protein IH984_04735 [Planctomycetes bacterium]|nr:hypothetical protein [Planctomycetota bacterium]
MIKLGIIVIASSTMALSSAIMQDDKDINTQVQITEPKQLIQETNTNDKTPQAIIDNNLSTSRSLLRDPLRRSRSLHTKPITEELLEDCREVARDVSPHLAMWLERLEANNSKEEFERALQRNARYLLGLVELRENNPVIYDFKMRVLKTGSEIKQVTTLLQEAVDTQSADQEMLEVRLRELVRIQATYSIEADVRYLIRINEYAADLHQRIEEQGSSFDETAEQRLQEILDKIKSKSTTAKQQNTTTSG